MAMNYGVNFGGKRPLLRTNLGAMDENNCNGVSCYFFLERDGATTVAEDPDADSGTGGADMEDTST
jgi:hypothetical protein